MKVELTIYSAQRGIMEGEKYSSVWAESEEYLSEPNKVGKPPMKMNCEWGVIDKLQGFSIPCVVICDVKMISGGGAKGGNFIKDVIQKTPQPLPSKL
jgi:hypothetical protein